MTSTCDPTGASIAAAHLVGARCRTCATHVFPPQSACPCCGGATDPVELPEEGTVWSWTVQRNAPKPPFVAHDDFEPFAVGYVDLGVIKIEGRFAGRPPGAWRIGDRVRIVTAAHEGDTPSYWFEAAAA
jgi:uncharacterized OB-fold protein